MAEEEATKQRLLRRAIQDAEWQIQVRRKLLKEWREQLRQMKRS